jgi:EpsI family protein
MSSGITQATTSITVDLSYFEEIAHVPRIKWVPRYIGNSYENLYHLKANEIEFDLFYAHYDGTDGELVSSSNRLYQQDRWTLVDRNRVYVNDVQIQQDFVTSSVGVQKTILYWYVVGDEILSTYRDVKIAQLIHKLKGNQLPSAIIAVAIDTGPNEPLKIAKLEQVASQAMDAISKLNKP